MDFTRDCTTRYQPSTTTKSSSLKGSEMRTGGSMTMPIDISAVEARMSMTRKGMKITKPMRKAARSSPITKAGMSVVVGTSSLLAGASLPDSLVNSARSDSRVWRNMNSRNGAVPLVMASDWLILPLGKGCTASSLALEKTGPMTNRVRNSARPISTWLGGTPLRFRALRVNPSTITIRVNDVSRMSMAGPSDTTVSSRRMVSGWLVGDAPGAGSRLSCSWPAAGWTAVGATGAAGVSGAPLTAVLWRAARAGAARAGAAGAGAAWAGAAKATSAAQTTSARAGSGVWREDTGSLRRAETGVRSAPDGALLQPRDDFPP